MQTCFEFQSWTPKLYSHAFNSQNGPERYSVYYVDTQTFCCYAQNQCAEIAKLEGPQRQLCHFNHQKTTGQEDQYN